MPNVSFVGFKVRTSKSVCLCEVIGHPACVEAVKAMQEEHVQRSREVTHQVENDAATSCGGGEISG